MFLSNFFWPVHTTADEVEIEIEPYGMGHNLIASNIETSYYGTSGVVFCTAPPIGKFLVNTNYQTSTR